MFGAEEDIGNRIRRSMDPDATRKTRFQECDQGKNVGVFVSGWKMFQKGVDLSCHSFLVLAGGRTVLEWTGHVTIIAVNFHISKSGYHLRVLFGERKVVSFL